MVESNSIRRTGKMYIRSKYDIVLLSQSSLIYVDRRPTYLPRAWSINFACNLISNGWAEMKNRDLKWIWDLKMKILNWRFDEIQMKGNMFQDRTFLPSDIGCGFGIFGDSASKKEPIDSVCQGTKGMMESDQSCSFKNILKCIFWLFRSLPVEIFCSPPVVLLSFICRFALVW